MKITINGNLKDYDRDSEILWQDNEILTDDFTMIILEDANSDLQGVKLGHPVGECPGTHNHLELLECFSDIVNRVFDPGFEVTTTDNGKAFDGYPEPDYSGIPEGAVL